MGQCTCVRKAFHGASNLDTDQAHSVPVKSKTHRPSGQCLINRVTVHLGTSRHFSGFPTYQELTRKLRSNEKSAGFTHGRLPFWWNVAKSSVAKMLAAPLPTQITVPCAKMRLLVVVNGLRPGPHFPHGNLASLQVSRLLAEGLRDVLDPILRRGQASMRLFKLCCQGVLCSLLLVFAVKSVAQKKANPPERAATLPGKPKSPAKGQTAGSKAEVQSTSGTPSDRDDGADPIRERDEWFYKQRSSLNGHIPAGARLRAFQHMQRMMVREGKLTLLANGSYAAVTPLAGTAVGGAWSSLGPMPTTGGFYTPVSGRIVAVAVDPSDTSGNTLLIGGAMGGIWRSTDAGATWTPVGDQNASLAIGSIAFANPSSTGGAGVVYAGTGEEASTGFDSYYGAGVLKSTDGGLHWTQTCTTASSTCPFIGPFTNTINFGFFNDGGARTSYVAVNPANPNLVLVGAQIPRAGGTVAETSGGIYCSSDGGATWTSLLIGEAGSFVGFATTSIAYAALGRPFGNSSGAPNLNGVYKSTNANASSCSGIAFTPVVQQPTTLSMGRIDLGIATSDSIGNTVYASVADATTSSATNLGVWVTTNGGTSWTQTAAPDICHQQCWYDNVVKVDPTNKDIVFLGGAAVSSSTAFEWVMRSTNGTTGGAFSPAIPTSPGGGDPTLPHVDEHAMAFVKLPTGKMRLYLGNDGGLWRTDDAGAATVTWTNLNQNLTLTQFYPNLSVNPSNPNIAFGGAQDNGSQIFQGTPDWTGDGHCGDGGQTAIDFQVPTSVYVTCQRIRILFSPSGGTDPASYVLIGTGINPNGTDAGDFIPPIATDPSTPGRVYFGTDHVYQSSDNGNSFSAISGALPTRTGNYLTAFGISPTNPAVFYTGANGGDLFVATNVASGSATFSQVGGQSQHPLRNVTAIAVDPHDTTANTVYAAFSGFAVSGQDTLGHIFASMNGGQGFVDASCTNIGGCYNPNPTDLPNIPVNDLLIDPDLPATTLYAATDVGIFQGTCTGTTCTWNTLGTGLPNVAVLSLKLHEASRTLVAGTHGRGAWSLTLTNFSFPAGPHISSLSPISAQAGTSSALTLTVGGSGLTGGTVQWKAGTTTTALSTTPVTDSQLTATVPTSLLAIGGPVQVSVSVASANSNSLAFGVLSAPPTISSVSPSNAPINSADTPITVTGTNFSSNSQIMLNPDVAPTTAQPHGQFTIPTTFVSTTQLTATIPATFIMGIGSTNSVGVRTPAPGGGITLSPPAGPTPLPTFVVSAPPPANDNFASAMPFNPLGGQLIVDSSAATTEATDPILPCVTQRTGGNGKNGSYNTVWFSFTPGSNGTISDLSTQFSNYDTTLAVFTGTSGNLTLVPGACNDDINPGVVIQSDLKNISVTGGTTYYIMVGSFGPPDPNPVALGGYSNITLSFTAGPPDFNITSTGTTMQTVNSGQTANFTNAISVAAQNGFASQVNLSCSLPVAAANTTCTVNPNTLASGSGTASVSVTTMAHGIAPPLLPTVRFRVHPQWIPFFLVALLLSVVLFRSALARRQRLVGALPFAVLVLFVLVQAIGCGGGSSGPPPPTGTPAGTYTVTVTGTSGSTTHTSTLTLKVN